MLVKHFRALLRSILLIYRLNKKYNIYRQILNKRVIGQKEEAAPWFVFSATIQLQQMDFKDKSVLEYGSGASTLWWAKRCKNICSIENNSEWYDLIRKEILPNNTTYHLCEDQLSYCNKVDPRNFDVVVIDGRWREEIFNKILSYNAPVISYIIIDNAERYPTYISLLKDLGYEEYMYYGFGPINAYEWATSILVKSDAI